MYSDEIRSIRGSAGAGNPEGIVPTVSTSYLSFKSATVETIVVTITFDYNYDDNKLRVIIS